MKKPIIEGMLRSRSSPESYSRGEKLFKAGAVFDAFHRGDLIGGNCEGESEAFYRLRIRLDDTGIREASCSCPYEYGGYCKHIIALALAYERTPDIFLVQKEVEDLLESMDKKDLVKLIAGWAEKDLDVYSWLELTAGAVAGKKVPAKGTERQNRGPQENYACKVRRILRGIRGYGGWEAYGMLGGMVDQLETILDAGEDRLEDGDPRAALEILTTLLKEIGASYEEFDDSNGELGGILDELAEPLVESILSAGLGESERARLTKDLEPYIQDLLEYGIDSMEAVSVALCCGLSGGEAPGRDDARLRDPILIEARLNILERGGRVEEFLYLCRKTGSIRRGLLKLIELGKAGKVFDGEANKLTQAEDSLAVAVALREAGREPEALRTAERGLSLKGEKYELGAWLWPIEEARGRTGQAVRACRAAFSEMPSLELFVELKRLYGKKWGTEKSKLLRSLQGTCDDDVLVEIHLLEEEWDQAIDIVSKTESWDYRLVDKVAEAVFPHRPEWVIEASRKQAEGLISKTESKYYSFAARWLGMMKQAYAASGETAKWSSYLERLKEKYPRRRALQAELDKL